MALLTCLAFSCSPSKEGKTGNGQGRLKVIASLYPLYEFARNISGGQADVALLLPPGIEPHSFEPRPTDIVNLGSADIFIYTNKFMEPWAEDILRGAGNSRLIVVDAGKGIDFIGALEDEEGRRGLHKHHDQEGFAAADPHIWLDFDNAQKIVDTLAEAFIAGDPAKRDVYLQNAEIYKLQLRSLDKRYRENLAGCKKRIFINGGHFTFGYLAARYGLKYIAAYGYSPDAEPAARDLADLSRLLRKNGLKHLFYEELMTPRIAQTIAEETGAELLKLHGAHNISREELAAGVTFIDLMEDNLEQLITGLQCR